MDGRAKPVIYMSYMLLLLMMMTVVVVVVINDIIWNGNHYGIGIGMIPSRTSVNSNCCSRDNNQFPISEPDCCNNRFNGISTRICIPTVQAEAEEGAER